MSKSLTVVERPIGELRDFKRNARTHSAEQIEKLKRSIDRFGFVNPVLIDVDGTILAGHGRVRAAKELGHKIVPTIILAHLSESERRAYAIADNKLAEEAGWDEDLLRLELGELKEAGFEVSLTGFEDAELDRLLADGLQEPPASAYKEQYGVIVICAGEDEQAAIYEKLKSEGYSCRVVTT